MRKFLAEARESGASAPLPGRTTSSGWALSFPHLSHRASACVPPQCPLRRIAARGHLRNHLTTGSVSHRTYAAESHVFSMA
jgi:hypothetical protein